MRDLGVSRVCRLGVKTKLRNTLLCHDKVYLVQYGSYAVILAEESRVAGMLWFCCSETGLANV